MDSKVVLNITTVNAAVGLRSKLVGYDRHHILVAVHLCEEMKLIFL